MVRRHLLQSLLFFISSSLFSLKFDCGFDYSVYYKSDFIPFFIHDSSKFFQNDLKDDSDLEDEENYVFDATELLSSLDGRDDRGIEGGEEKKEESPEFVYSDRNGNVRRFSYDDEQMTARKIVTGVSEDGKPIESVEVVSVYGKKIKKRIFDEKFRLSSTEVFLLDGNAKKVKRSSNRKYFYKQNSNVPFKSSEIRAGADEEIQIGVDTTFNEKGLVILRDEYSIETLESGKKSRKSLKHKSIHYDEIDRVIFEEESNWYYTDGKNSKIIKKNVYEYTNFSENPDYSYYEDGQLRLKRNYDNDKSYYEKTFMDDGFWILAYFEDDVKKSEIVYFGDVEVRRRYFYD